MSEIEFVITQENLPYVRGFEMYNEMYEEFGGKDALLGATFPIEISNIMTKIYIQACMGEDIPNLRLDIESLQGIISNIAVYRNFYGAKRLWEASAESDLVLRFILKVIFDEDLHRVFVDPIPDFYFSDDNTMKKYILEIHAIIALLYRGLINPDFIALKSEYIGFLPQIEVLTRYFKNPDAPERDQWRKEVDFAGIIYEYFVFASRELLVILDGSVMFINDDDLTEEELLGENVYNRPLISTGDGYMSKHLEDMGCILSIVKGYYRSVFFTTSEVIVGWISEDGVYEHEILCRMEDVVKSYPEPSYYTSDIFIETEDTGYYISGYDIDEIRTVPLPSKVFGAYNLIDKNAISVIVFEDISNFTPVYMYKSYIKFPPNTFEVEPTNIPDEPIINIWNGDEWLQFAKEDFFRQTEDLTALYGSTELWPDN